MSDDERIASILGEWQERRDRGEQVAPETVIGANPELAAELRAHFDALPEVDRGLAEASRPLRALPQDRYADFKTVGMGGMGIVYWAIDTDLNREVAFKVIRPGAGDEADSRATDPASLSPPPKDTPASQTFEMLKQRFLQEAWVTGGMAHPGIVPVYELGQTPEGVPYYTMRFVKGERTLADAIDACKGKDAGERLKLLEPFLKVCDTIRYAHAQGVIHRDIKPDNVALGEYGEVVVIDWGMAKVQDGPDITANTWQERLHDFREAQDLKTVAGALGTPGYMSPEAALGKVDQVDARSDVYSLGVVLFQLLTGRLPFTFNTYGELLKKLREGAPPEAAAVDPTVPDLLSKICAKALAPKPANRFQDVGQLADAIRTWQRESEARKEVRALMREADRALEGVAGLKGDALLKQLDRVTVLSSRVLELRPGHRRTQTLLDTVKETRAKAIQEREQAVRDREQAERKALLLRVGVGAAFVVIAGVAIAALLYAAGRKEAWTATGRADADRTRAREAEERAIETGALATDATRRAAQALAQAEAERKAKQKADTAAEAAEEAKDAAAEDADAARNALAKAQQELEEERTAKVDALEAAEAERIAKSEALTLVDTTRQGRDAALADNEKLGERLRRSRALALGNLARVEEKRDPSLAALLAQEALRLDPKLPGATNLRESFQSPDDLRSVVLHDNVNVWGCEFSPDGTRIAISCRDRTVGVWTRDAQHLVDLRGHRDNPGCSGFSPDGNRILTYSGDGTARIWDLEGRELAVLKGHEGGVSGAAFSPKGNLILTWSSPDRTARLWGVDGKSKVVIALSEADQHWALFSPNGDQVLTCTAYQHTAREEHRTITLWNLKGKKLRVLMGHKRSVTSCTFFPDGAHLLSGSDDGTGRIWNLSEGTHTVLIGHSESVNQTAVSPDGALLATGGDARVHLWDREGHLRTVVRLPEGRWGPKPVFASDGSYFITYVDGTEPRIWDLNGKLLAVLRGHSGGYKDYVRARPSPDGSRVLTVGTDGKARLWFVDGEELVRLAKIPITRELTDEERKRYAELLDD